MKVAATVSSKRQITIPAEMFRALELKEGQKVLLEMEEDRIILTPRPQNLTRFLAGAAKGTYGNNEEEIDSYVEEGRAGWGQRQN